MKNKCLPLIIDQVDIKNFNLPLLTWFDAHGRTTLPWQHPRSAYRVWLSEMMLQQTQVKTVIPYFTRFLIRFPDVQTLAEASEDDVLAYWSGLGYYSRARNIHKTAKLVHHEYQSLFPSDVALLQALPGIGPSTAAAIASLAFNQPTAILDGNVKRVLSRYFLIAGQPEQADVKRVFWQYAKACMPDTRCSDYTQAIMDLGALCCTTKNPSCDVCPLKTTCLAKQHDQVSCYPHKKPKKIRPQKKEQFLVLYTHDQRVYLEKRPSSGLWGGLWCLPYTHHEACPKTFVHHTYCLQTGTPRDLITLKHSFTHFQLEIKALSIKIIEDLTVSNTLPGRWFTAQELHAIGLPKPISTILHHFIHHDH